MTGQPKLITVPFLIWILWPAVFALAFRNAPHDFLGYVLKEYFFYPPSIDHITNYWLKDAPLYKSLYVNAWYVNSLLIGMQCVSYSIANPSHLHEVGQKHSIIKSIIFALFGFAMSGVVYSDMGVAPPKPLSGQTSFMVNHDFGIAVFFPIVYVGASCAPVAASGYLLIAWRKIFGKFQGESK